LIINTPQSPLDLDESAIFAKVLSRLNLSSSSTSSFLSDSTSPSWLNIAIIFRRKYRNASNVYIDCSISNNGLFLKDDRLTFFASLIQSDLTLSKFIGILSTTFPRREDTNDLARFWKQQVCLSVALATAAICAGFVVWSKFAVHKHHEKQYAIPPAVGYMLLAGEAALKYLDSSAWVCSLQLILSWLGSALLFGWVIQLFIQYCKANTVGRLVYL
jgi:hypothetical protein